MGAEKENKNIWGTEKEELRIQRCERDRVHMPKDLTNDLRLLSI